MPITMMGSGQQANIARISGSMETKRFLGNLGFVQGTAITIVSSFHGNVIVQVKDSRVAINTEMARHIHI